MKNNEKYSDTVRLTLDTVLTNLKYVPTSLMRVSGSRPERGTNDIVSSRTQ